MKNKENINNNIQEDYCSFEVSTLLYKKGARLQTHYNSQANCLLWYWKYGDELHSWFFFASFDNMLPAPTHALAIKWIRENFGYFIGVRFGHGVPDWYDFFIEDTDVNKHAWYYESPISFDSYEEATKAALLYTLENLIK